MTGQPWWEIGKPEATELAKAAENVFAQYDLEVSPMVAAWINLATVATAIYGPRAFAYRDYQRVRREQFLAQQNGEGATVQ